MPMPLPTTVANGMFDFPDNQIDYPQVAFTDTIGTALVSLPPTSQPAIAPVLLLAAAAYFLGA